MEAGVSSRKSAPVTGRRRSRSSSQTLDGHARLDKRPQRSPRDEGRKRKNDGIEVAEKQETEDDADAENEEEGEEEDDDDDDDHDGHGHDDRHGADHDDVAAEGGA